MKHWMGTLALSLLAAGGCLAQSGDAESERSRQLTEAKRQAAEARSRAEVERALEEQRQGLQQPIYRYPSPPIDPAGMFEEAAKLERSGKGPAAVQMYARSARAGNPAAARRLAEIYDQGMSGIGRDHAVSLQWAHVARLLADDPGGERIVERLLREAQTLEHQGRGAEAVRLYERAARSGSGEAAFRLGEIYDKGISGVARDYAESLKWYNAARMLREDVPGR